MARPAAERWRTFRGQRHLIWTGKSWTFPLYPLLMGLLFFSGDSCDFTCLPFVFQRAWPKPDYCHSTSDWFVVAHCTSIIRAYTHTHTHINKHRFSAGSPWWTDLATVRCYGRLSPHSHIQNASVFPSVPAFTAEWQNRGHARCGARVGRTASMHFFSQTRKTTERIIQTRKPCFNDFFQLLFLVIITLRNLLSVCDRRAVARAHFANQTLFN